MPRIEPMRAVRYPVPQDRDLSTRIAPPYDVLDEGPKRDLLRRDSRNIVEIDLPVTPPKTVGPDAAYVAAGDCYRAWLADGTLVQDRMPAIFAYEQCYEVAGVPLKRRGLFTRVGLEPFGRSGGGIHRHEMTIKSGTDDRLKLMEATAAQLSPVFGVFNDTAHQVGDLLEPVFATEPQVIARTAHDSVEHRLWAMTDAKVLQDLQAVMEPIDVFIADGHHRYTTALNYQQAHPEATESNACLMVLVAAQDPGMIVLSTHRVLMGLEGFSVSALSGMLKSDGRYVLTPTTHGAEGLAALAEALPGAGHHAVGLFDPAEAKTYILTSRDADPMKRDLPDRAEVWRRLDVAVFHEGVVDRLIRPAFGGAAITYKYPHELTELRRLTEESPGRLGIVMQATPLQSVIDVSLAGEVMPPKSTFFFPKLATGLVINPLK